MTRNVARVNVTYGIKDEDECQEDDNKSLQVCFKLQW